MPLTSPAIRTLADLLDRLGGVPLDRIRMRPFPGSATVQDVITILEHEGRRCELVEGVRDLVCQVDAGKARRRQQVQAKEEKRRVDGFRIANKTHANAAERCRKRNRIRGGRAGCQRGSKNRD